MTHGSLFSGIGGFDLAAQWMGWENKFHCEWNEFGKRVLNYYWPKAECYGDITKTDFTIWRGRIDVLTGGFPCQPYSAAGKRLGKADERHLWPEMLRAIREIQPRYIVGENVYGLINWNGGLVFNEVQTDLEAIGYKIQPVILPACAVNAPHRRERVWFVANRANAGVENLRPKWENKIYRFENTSNSTSKRLERGMPRNSKLLTKPFKKGAAANTSCIRLQQPHDSRYWRNGLENQDSDITANANGFGLRNEINRLRKSGQLDQTGTKHDWKNFPTQSPVCGGDDGLSTGLDGITFPKWRNESIKAYGNAVVPQVAFQIFKAIAAHQSFYS